MHGREDGLGVPVGVRRMDVALDDIVVHQAIYDVGAFAFSGTDDDGMEQEVAFVDEAVDADALTLSEVFEGVVRVQ